MPNNSKLGSGLDAIFGGSIDDLLNGIQDTAESDVLNRDTLKLSDIHPNPYQSLPMRVS